MKNSFWGIVGMACEFMSIEAETFTDALRIAYGDSKHRFCCSRWFIDVKDKFRIFSFNNISYIAKEASNKKANLEIANSKKAYNKLDGKVIGTRTIRIVVPKKITLPSNDRCCFLVSEYLGSDINECVYTNKAPLILLNDCLSVIKLLLKNGVTYRGYLPRNIIENRDNIYLFDWEDASFDDPPAFGKFDHLWRTNFLLNWSYLFDYHDLDKELKGLDEIQEPLYEPPLVKYENTFRKITNDPSSDSSLRNKIDKIVFGSELPLIKTPDSFYIRPNDMGHLIADVFPSEIDVLHDMLSNLFRKHDEHIFTYNIQAMTHLLVLYYKAVLVQNNFIKLPLQFYALIPILMMIDEYVSERSYQDILSTHTLPELLAKISQVSQEQSVTRIFLSGVEGILSHQLNVKLRDRIAEACPTSKVEHLKVDKIISFILYESSRLHKQD